MKKKLRKLIQSAGWDLHRFSASSSYDAQLALFLRHSRINIVFDIGANVGQFATGIRSTGYPGKIVSFEPLTQAHQRLVKAANGDRDWIVHERTAIGDTNGEIKINIAGNSVSSSVLKMLTSHENAAASSVYVSSELTPITTLDSISEAYLTETSELFIKIDTQGFESQVISGALSTFSKAKGVLCELSLVPLYEGQQLWDEIIKRMQNMGFTLWALQKGFTDPRTGQSLQVDGVFVRNNKKNA